MMKSLAWSCGAAMALAATTAPIAENTGRIKCSAIYRERIAVPPDAVLEALLEDVSKDDAPAALIATTRIEKPGNPPYTFEVAYDPATIDESHRYAVRARIRAGGVSWFASQGYPVLTQGHGKEAQILLRRTVPARAGTPELPDDPGPPPARLENTWWKLTQVGITTVATTEGQQEPHLILEPEGMRASGSGGCNRMTGTYELNGERLTFGPMAGTLMACQNGMETEKAFLQALARVQGWKIEGQRLNLLDATGGVVAQFVAKPMK
jgi:putative lipoprotein